MKERRKENGKKWEERRERGEGKKGGKKGRAEGWGGGGREGGTKEGRKEGREKDRKEGREGGRKKGKRKEEVSSILQAHMFKLPVVSNISDRHIVADSTCTLWNFYFPDLASIKKKPTLFFSRVLLRWIHLMVATSSLEGIIFHSRKEWFQRTLKIRNQSPMSYILFHLFN